MSFIKNTEIALDAMSLASGGMPSNFIFRLGSMFFGRKKGMTKAQLKKLMMRRRRMFVDTVIMHHERLHNKNRQDVIDKTKEKISEKPKSKVKPKLTPKTSPSLGRGRKIILNQRKPHQEHRPKTQINGFVGNQEQKSKLKWTDRVKNQRGGSSREN